MQVFHLTVSKYIFQHTSTVLIIYVEWCSYKETFLIIKNELQKILASDSYWRGICLSTLSYFCKVFYLGKSNIKVQNATTYTIMMARNPISLSNISGITLSNIYATRSLNKTNQKRYPWHAKLSNIQILIGTSKYMVSSLRPSTIESNSFKNTNYFFSLSVRI